jgi:hypothetical protein
MNETTSISLHIYIIEKRGLQNPPTFAGKRVQS